MSSRNHIHQLKKKFLGEYKNLFFERIYNSFLSFRRNIWEENLGKIRKHNLEADIGLHKYTMEMNRFGDLVCL